VHQNIIIYLTANLDIINNYKKRKPPSIYTSAFVVPASELVHASLPPSKHHIAKYGSAHGKSIMLRSRAAPQINYSKQKGSAGRWGRTYGYLQYWLAVMGNAALCSPMGNEALWSPWPSNGQEADDAQI
jgi:hypothetical protein